MGNLFTTGQIADVLKEPPDRIIYIIRRDRIKPVDRIGIYRLFSAIQVTEIRKAMYNIRIHRPR
ncbi:hypothetical protein LCGC14_0561460 [marine sediment metagenome]|uniref:Uncharacterized protein n=1 Tax=marine sediment metagenome TaxID=412755 RepID=A0A0F9RS30_9ZZZZ